jgi:signal transduction histidine kinase
VGVERLRRGYADERRSAETETARRYEARLLHDTVLATLTVVAHSGAGVPADALRAQAASDSRLLEQLRTRGIQGLRAAAPEPPVRGAVERQSDPSRDLHDTVDGWCREHAFTVVWHGDDTVDAPARERDALVRAVLASLSNARLHSGESTAEITIGHTEDMLRVVVTDTGVGFDRASVPPGRLGVAESIEARVAAVGGAARVFTSPGRGTTVLFEVPR